ncbi:DUF4097 family beta strand repeat-containing protein [Streptomyces sp. NPDC060194]|uniref:DUF4097 family beta strand repeat-containing protein n=1 Tax=Streptomyces sp. NPDC060194 TaxID=3347069 RepID=UPI0036511D6C
MGVGVRGRRGGVAVAGALAGALLVGGCGGELKDAEAQTRDFPLGGGTALVVDSRDSALEVVAADVEGVRVTRWFDGSVVLGEAPKATWAMRDGRLTLRIDCDGFVAGCSARHRVEVPRDVAVSIENEDGSVTASGLETGVGLRSRDGRVVVRDVAGDLDLRSEDGSVEVTGVRSKHLRVRSEDGRTRLAPAAVPDRVEVVSRDGLVDIELPEAAYKVTTDVRDGRLRVDVPRDAASPHEVSAESRDGQVTIRTA